MLVLVFSAVQYPRSLLLDSGSGSLPSYILVLFLPSPAPSLTSFVWLLREGTVSSEKVSLLEYLLLFPSEFVADFVAK